MQTSILYLSRICRNLLSNYKNQWCISSMHQSLKLVYKSTSGCSNDRKRAPGSIAVFQHLMLLCTGSVNADCNGKCCTCCHQSSSTNHKSDSSRTQPFLLVSTFFVRGIVLNSTWLSCRRGTNILLNWHSFQGKIPGWRVVPYVEPVSPNPNKRENEKLMSW